MKENELLKIFRWSGALADEKIYGDCYPCNETCVSLKSGRIKGSSFGSG